VELPQLAAFWRQWHCVRRRTLTKQCLFRNTRSDRRIENGSTGFFHYKKYHSFPVF
jgi:hypothetical protein